MSAQQQRMDFLTLRYVNRTYKHYIPAEIIKLIQLFYDEHCYWTVKDEEFQTFMNVKTGKRMLCPNSFTIHGIEFEILSFPNGINKKHSGIVIIVLKIKLPPNIEYFEFYTEIKCEQTSHLVKRLCRAPSNQNRAFLSQLSELQNMKTVSFTVLVNIKYIKLNILSTKWIDYYSVINPRKTYYKFPWIVNGALMQKFDKMRYKQSLFSKSFDANNWCLRIVPTSDGSHGRKGKAEIYLCCLCLPNTVISMDIKFGFTVNGDFTGMKTRNFGNFTKGGRSTRGTFIDCEGKESLLIIATLEIMGVYDRNNKKIDKLDWHRHSIGRELGYFKYKHMTPGGYPFKHLV